MKCKFNSAIDYNFLNIYEYKFDKFVTIEYN